LSEGKQRCEGHLAGPLINRSLRAGNRQNLVDHIGGKVECIAVIAVFSRPEDLRHRVIILNLSSEEDFHFPKTVQGERHPGAGNHLDLVVVRLKAPLLQKQIQPV